MNYRLTQTDACGNNEQVAGHFAEVGGAHEMAQDLAFCGTRHVQQLNSMTGAWQTVVTYGDYE